MENQKTDRNIIVLVQCWINDLVNIGMNYSRISARLRKSPSTIQKIVAQNRMPRRDTLEALGNYYLKIFGSPQDYGVAAQAHYLAHNTRIHDTLDQTLQLLDLQKETVMKKMSKNTEGQIKALVISEEGEERHATVKKCLHLGYAVESADSVQSVLSVANTFFDLVLISGKLRVIGLNYLSINFKGSFHQGKKPMFLLISDYLTESELVNNGLIDGVFVINPSRSSERLGR